MSELRHPRRLAVVELASGGPPHLVPNLRTNAAGHVPRTSCPGSHWSPRTEAGEVFRLAAVRLHAERRRCDAALPRASEEDPCASCPARSIGGGRPNAGQGWPGPRSCRADREGGRSAFLTRLAAPVARGSSRHSRGGSGATRPSGRRFVPWRTFSRRWSRCRQRRLLHS